ncbi:MAG TPA: ATP-dependent DNA ligase [Solirubrobacteraceae bacterium]|nr:ATP-dependent DNA ligase [Solirubrobacteraceae bacterium]
MTLPLVPPLKPQLALSRKALPVGDDYVYEVKLDGFRCLAFVDAPQPGAKLTGSKSAGAEQSGAERSGDEQSGAEQPGTAKPDTEQLFLQSRSGKPLGRYFPELAFPAGRYVLDGEIVVRGADAREDFDALGQRIHPAVSRIERLSQETPAIYVAFDLLALDEDSYLEHPLTERRAALEALLARPEFDGAPIELMHTVATAQAAEPWLSSAEGVIAKELSAPYLPGMRRGMVKIKRTRTIDAVVTGWRPGKEQHTVGALILALYDSDELRVVGHCSGLTAKDKRALVDSLAPYETGERGSGDPSRWSSGRELEWIALRPELVVEIDFDHVSAGRIRHGAKLRRWRDDKPPAECTYDQLSG